MATTHSINLTLPDARQKGGQPHLQPPVGGLLRAVVQAEHDLDEISRRALGLPVAHILGSTHPSSFGRRSCLGQRGTTLGPVVVPGTNPTHAGDNGFLLARPDGDACVLWTWHKRPKTVARWHGRANGAEGAIYATPWTPRRTRRETALRARCSWPAPTSDQNQMSDQTVRA